MLAALAAPAPPPPDPTVNIRVSLVQAGKFLPRTVPDGDLRGEVANAVGQEGGTVISSAPAAAGCVTPECFGKLVDRTATHILLVQGKRSGQGYDVSVAFWDVGRAEFIGRERDAGCRSCV